MGAEASVAYLQSELLQARLRTCRAEDQVQLLKAEIEGLRAQNATLTEALLKKEAEAVVSSVSGYAPPDQETPAR